MSPQQKLAPKPPDRYMIKAGLDEGQPFIEVVDTLACTSMQYELTAALEMAAGVNHMVVSLLNAMKRQARQAQKGIVTSSGMPL